MVNVAEVAGTEEPPAEEVPGPGSVASEPSIPHQPALDGLRGVAVAGVLLFHGDHLVGGYLGVDAFFVLSGFLITTLLLVEHSGRGRISLGHFWSRRARRLLPALGCVLLAVAIYAAVVAKPGELPTIRGDSLATLFYVANWHAIFSAGDYFAIFRSPSPLQHTWSLAIEEQFYLVWPLVLLAVLRRGMPARAAAQRVLVLCAALAVGSIVLAQLLYRSSDASRVYYGTDTRAAAILLGAGLAAALAAWGPVTGRRARQVLEGAALVAAAGLLWAWTHLSGDSPSLYRGGLLLCGVAVTVLIASATHPSRGPVAAALSLRPLCWLGIISYGVYLWHWPIFVWLNEDRTGLSGWPLFAVQCAVTFGVALVSFRFIERPIRYGWGTPRVMSWAVPLTATALVAVLIAATPASGIPVGAAWVPSARYVVAPTDKAWMTVLDRLRTENTSLAHGPSHGTRVFVWGDSVALTLASQYPGGMYHGRAIDGTALGLIGCSLLDLNFLVSGNGYEQDPNCRGWPVLLQQAVEAYRPKVVALMYGPWEMFDRQARNGREDAGSALLTSELDTQLERLRTIVTGAGARLVILTTPCFAPPQLDHSAIPAATAIWRDQDRIDWINHVWRGFADRHRTDTSVRDLSSLLCPGGTPIEQQAGDRYRVDGMHFTEPGTTLVWQWLDRHVADAPPPT